MTVGMPGIDGSLATGGDAGHNLPTPQSDLVGRESELCSIAQLVARERLVTLSGGPGVGKTRLAVHAASDAVATMPGGVFLVDLALVSQPQLVVNAVGAVLGTRERAGEPFVHTLTEHLRRQRLMIVLDNCEHVLHACADLVCRLQRECPEVRVLATSREELGVIGELAWPVQPLSPPAGDAPDEVAANPAARLFLARSAAPVTLDTASAAHIARICRRLDGVPLAIELAATRVGELSLADIEANIEDRFELLRTDRTDFSPRQRSFRATLEWSYDLLSESERLLLRRLSVFAGPFTAGAATQVCSPDRIGGDGVAGVLARLTRRSLLVRLDGDEGRRWRLHESVRHFAAEKLALAGETDALEGGHLRWCTRLVERVDTGPADSEQGEVLAMLATIRADLRAALDRAVEHEAERGLALAAGLTRFWISQGSLDEGRDYLARSLAAAPDDAPARAKALWGTGLIGCLLGDFAAVGPAVEAGMALAGAAGDGAVLSRLSSLIGVTRIFTDPPGAIDVLDDAVALARRHGEVVTLVESLAMQGFAWALSGDLSEASASLAECLACGDGLEGQALVMGLIGFGHVQLHQGDVASARKHLGDGLALARQEDNHIWVALALAYLAELEAVLGDHQAGRRRGAEAIEVARRTGAPPVVGLALALAGEVELMAGDPRASVPLFDEALVLSENGERGGVRSRALVGRGRAHLDLAQLDAAQELLDEAVTLVEAGRNRVALAAAQYHQGRLAAVGGDHRSALDHHRRALANRDRSGDRLSVPASVEAVAGQTALTGDTIRALRLVAGARAVRLALGLPLSAEDRANVDTVAALAAQSVPPEAQAAAEATGAQLSGVSLISYACAGGSPAP